MILTVNIPKVHYFIIITSHIFWVINYDLNKNAQIQAFSDLYIQNANNILVNKTRPNDYEGWIIFDQFKRPMGSLGDYLKNQERVLHLFIHRVGGQTVDWRLLTVIYCVWNSLWIAHELELGQNLTVRISIPLSNRETRDKRTQDSLEITNMKIWKRNLQWTTFHQEKNFLMQSNAIFTVLSKAIIE